MDCSAQHRMEAIRHNQNLLLYQGIKFSLAGSILAATFAIYFFGPLAQSFDDVLTWYAAITCVYIARAIDSALFRLDVNKHKRSRYWSIRFAIGALAASLAWSSSLWLVYPQNNPAHQVLLVFTLGGVASGSLASLPYDVKLSNAFQSLILTAIVIRLFSDGSDVALEVIVLSCFVFGFVISCGEEVSKNYLDLLRLRQDSLETNLTLIRTTEQMAQLGYWQWDLHSTHLEISTNLAQMVGFSAQQVTIRDCLATLPAADRIKVETACARVIHSGEDTQLEFRMTDSAGNGTRSMRQVLKLLTDSAGKHSLLGAVQDITDIKSAERRIYSMAYFDELTKLANRANFHERLELEIKLAKVRSQRFAIIYIDLDDFKGINDSYGHECGDLYLKHFAAYLNEFLRHEDLSARLGGDEFCILLSNIKDKNTVEQVTMRCMDYCNHIVQLGTHRIFPKLSIGVSIYPDDAALSDSLLHCADMAMYNIKQSGKHSYAFYDSSMATDYIQRVKLEADLRLALQNNHFELWYQPKINIRENKLIGVEALLRWRDAERGMIPPAQFINTAERIGLIKEIGEWVFDRACAQLFQWNAQGMQLSMAINISGDHFVSDKFYHFASSTIEQYQLKHADIEIEITESLSRDPHEHAKICKKLRSTGIRIAIDDFGTGYSSLSVLDNLEADTLKIDKSFIDDITLNPNSRLIVKSIIDLSLGLGYDVIAEGVETVEQLNLLRILNCPCVQGYFFSKPVEAIQIPALLNNDWSLIKAA